MAKDAPRLDEFKQNSSNFFRRFRKNSSLKKMSVYVLLLTALHSTFGDEIVAGARYYLTAASVFSSRMMKNLFESISVVRYIFLDVNEVLFKLKEENARLKSEINGLKYLKIESEQLRKLLCMKESTGYDIVVARVLKFFSNDYVRSFILDVGSLSGVSLDDAVIVETGLVGRIVDVHDDWSKVMLITDTNSNVPVKIGESQINAIVTGDNSKTLKISMIYEDMPVKAGDLVETSGYGGVFDHTVPVGKVVGSSEDLRVSPKVNFNSMEYVGILKRKQ